MIYKITSEAALYKHNLHDVLYIVIKPYNTSMRKQLLHALVLYETIALRYRIITETKTDSSEWKWGMSQEA